MQAKKALLLENVQLQEALANVRQLEGLLPICCGCKTIRGDQNYWHRVGAHITEHTEATFTHGYCLNCLEKRFPGSDGEAFAPSA